MVRSVTPQHSTAQRNTTAHHEQPLPYSTVQYYETRSTDGPVLVTAATVISMAALPALDARGFGLRSLSFAMANRPLHHISRFPSPPSAGSASHHEVIVEEQPPGLHAPFSAPQRQTMQATSGRASNPPSPPVSVLLPNPDANINNISITIVNNNNHRPSTACRCGPGCEGTNRQACGQPWLPKCESDPEVRVLASVTARQRGGGRTLTPCMA